jgi:hypothetical protein
MFLGGRKSRSSRDSTVRRPTTDRERRHRCPTTPHVPGWTSRCSCAG